MWKWLLKTVMNYIVGKDVFGNIQVLVEHVAKDEKMSGAEKKEHVLTKTKEIGSDFASHMLNFAVEAAVTFLKEKNK